MEGEIIIRVSRDEALVLSSWLRRTTEAGQPVPFEDQAEQRVLWDLDATLESGLDEVVSDRYREHLDLARRRVRDEE